MFDVGAGELLALLVIGFFIFGPDRLPDLAKQAGRGLRQARTMLDKTRRQVADELGPEYANFDPRDLDPKRLVRKHILDDLGDLTGDDEEPDTPSDTRPGHRGLQVGESAPFDAEAT